mgnify:CR=1 FL=1
MDLIAVLRTVECASVPLRLAYEARRALRADCALSRNEYYRTPNVACHNDMDRTGYPRVRIWLRCDIVLMLTIQ